MATKDTKRKPRELTIKEKVDLINREQTTGKSQRALAAEFGIGKTQVQTILKRKAEWLSAYEDNMKDDRKRIKLGTEQYRQDVDFLTYEWFQRARGLNLPVSGPLIQEKARQFAASVGNDDFKASNGWLDRFKNRHNINMAVISGESGAVNEETVTEWKNKLPEIMKGYDPRDVFNMDESGLFYRALPDRTLRIRGEECKGGKRSKERLTASFCVNMAGEFEKTLVIGKCAKPRCFKRVNVHQLPVTWEFNKKAWMTTDIFTRWINAFNNRMKRQARHVLLFMDNAPSHPKDLRLSNVKVVPLPANTTSKLQPLDQGIIKTVKSRYRKRLLQAVLAKMDKGEDITNISKCVSVLDAINWITAAVKEVSCSTVKRCFAKAGMTDECLDIDEEEDIPLSDLVARVQNHLGLDNESVEDYLACDDDLDTCETDASDLEQRIIEEFVKPADSNTATSSEHAENAEESDEESDLPQTVVEDKSKITNVRVAIEAVEQLKTFLLNKDATHLLGSVYELQNGLCELSVTQGKQTSILNFFK